MDLQNTDSVMTPEQAKARLLDFGAEWEAEKKAAGPLGTWRGKAVVGGAVGALALGLLLAGPVKRLVRPSAPARVPSFPTWFQKQERKQDVKKAAVGGISLGLVLKLMQPLLPHIAQYASRRYATWRVGKAQAAAAHGQSGV
jgi:hypothetical protein